MAKINKSVIIKIFVIIIVLIMAAAAAVNIFSAKNTFNRYSSDLVTVAPFGGIVKETGLVQEISVNKEINIENIRLMFATYGRKNTSDITFKFIKNDNVLYEKTMNTFFIDDNSYVNFEGINCSINEKDKAFIVISSDNAKDNNAVTLWLTNDIEDKKFITDSYEDFIKIGSNNADKADIKLTSYKYNSVTGEKALIEGTPIMTIYDDMSFFEYWNYNKGMSGCLLYLFLIIVIILLAAVLFIKLFLYEDNSEDDVNSESVEIEKNTDENYNENTSECVTKERTKRHMKLIIQIPCYNEEQTLPQTVADLPKEIEGIDEIEYLIINDGSSDRTVEVAKECGVHHIVNQKINKGLAYGFMAGIDACLRLGADIIVNTDADNQYCGADIEKLVRPIIEGKSDIVIGERPIDETEHFSWKKKKFQHLGSYVVRVASDTEIPDAPSGFRAYSRDAALKINVVNKYTYTLETIIQAGSNRMAITSVPIRTNPETRKSRLFKSMWAYMKRSATVIIRSFMMYKPLKFFGILGSVVLLLGVVLGIRFLCFYFWGTGAGHIQSLILSSILILTGFQTIVIGLQADIIAANRKILEDIQYRVRRMDYDSDKNDKE